MDHVSKKFGSDSAISWGCSFTFVSRVHPVKCTDHVQITFFHVFHLSWRTTPPKRFKVIHMFGRAGREYNQGKSPNYMTLSRGGW